MKLDFTSQPSSKSTLPFTGLQQRQQCGSKVQTLNKKVKKVKKPKKPTYNLA
jgi:hypothetical protein